MSIWYSQDLVCTRCDHAFSTVLARGIHARRVPEVRDQILRGELHQIRCPACNATLEAHVDVAYTDFARNHWVHVATPDQLADWQAIERQALETFDRYLRGGPAMVAALAERFTVRVVFDLDELRERLVIWEAGLEDAVVECVKLACLRERPDIAGPWRRIRLRVVEEAQLTLAAIDRTRPRADLARWSVSRAVLDEVTTARADWQARMPALFARGFVSLDRYLYAE